jgi:glycosyltransferase involved in cell wall biosynthesis
MPQNNFSPRVSLISGVVHSGDAISETVLADLEAIDRLSRTRRWNIDARVYCASATAYDSRIEVLNDWRDILRQPHFQKSDLYIYHFGIYNALHDSMHFARRDSAVVTFFHNVTPPQYCAPEAEEVIYQSYRQIETLRCANAHMSASKFSARQLEAHIGRRVEVIPLFGPNASAGAAQHRRDMCPEDALRVLYCGRFTQSKGAAILLEALAQSRVPAEQKIDVTLAGIMDFSDRDYIDGVRLVGSYLPGNVQVRFAPNMTSAQLQSAYAGADVFVLPSFHEGFGMPAVEALSSGTPVICSDAGALPEVTNGLALTFPAGASSLLAEKLALFADALRRGNVLCDSGEFPRNDWRAKILSYATTYSRQAYIGRIMPRFAAFLDQSRPVSTSYLTKLESLGTELFGSSEGRPSAEDAAVTGATLALEISELAERDINNAIRSLLKWPFDREQKASDIAYWRNELKPRGAQGLINRLAASSEVRQSAARLQVGVTLQALLREFPLGETAQRAAAASSKGLDMKHPDIALLLSSSIPVSEFIREAYRVILRREPDPEGFGSRFVALNSGALTRQALIHEILASPEYASLAELSEVQGSGTTLLPSAV